LLNDPQQEGPDRIQVGAFLLAAQFPGQDHSQVLERTLDTAVAAEAAGLDSVWLAEHHFVPYGVCPSAITLAALLLGRTRRITVGTAVSVLPTVHPVALGEQAALLHLTTGGRFALGVGRGGPWVDLDVFGTGISAFERDFPESLQLLLRWLDSTQLGADGARYAFPEVAVVPLADGRDGSGGPPVVVACTSRGTLRLAAEHGLPMLLGMHSGDLEKAEMVAAYRAAALAAGHGAGHVARLAGQHLAVGVAQIADRTDLARSRLLQAMPGWLRAGLGAHRTVDGREQRSRDPEGYTRLLCGLHPVGTPRLCVDRLARTAERTGIRRFALLVEGTGDRALTLDNVACLGAEVLPQLR
jgi:alkanesulfonate monooxygenase SsuD/methylene tetrahydromethanopterin reductase-like flavin-dependent oxidoreductase (luciferase family)